MKILPIVVLLVLFTLNTEALSASWSSCPNGSNISVSEITTLKNVTGNRLTEGPNELFALAIENNEMGPIFVYDVGLLITTKGGVKISNRTLFGDVTEDLKATNKSSRRYAPLIVKSLDPPSITDGADGTSEEIVFFERRTYHTKVKIAPGEQKVILFYGTAEDVDASSSVRVGFFSLWWKTGLVYNCNEPANLVYALIVGKDEISPTKLVADAD